MVKFKIDDKEVEAKAGETILQVAQRENVFVPYFCYHPKLSVAGNCRMCLVQVEGQGKPVIACREPVREGIAVRTNTPEVKKMQQGVLEFILVNHPLDCPICDQSGECDLQDNYFRASLFPSRLEDQKIHKPKVRPLGPRVTLDDERCIACSRCVRFCDEVAGVHELSLTERGGHTTLMTFPGAELKNPYSLCTVDICPVGALTSTDFRFKKRVWFLKTTPSICTGCATGCNVKMDWDDGIVYRYRPRTNEAVNQCWMCDEGRLTYKQLNENRVTDPMMRKNGDWARVSWDEALERIVAVSPPPVPSPLEGEGQGGGALSVILSAQCSCEENFALYQFVKKTWPQAKIFATGRECENPSHDTILIDADKNPNWNFLKLLERNLGRGMELPEGGVVIAMGPLSDEVVTEVIASQAKLSVWITANRAANDSFADLILAKASFAEQEGTFINRQGRIQRFWQGFPPKGHAKPVWEMVNALAMQLGQAPVGRTAREVFETMAAKLPELKELTYEKIGDQGWNTASQS